MRPDVVVLDIKLPGMSGVEVARALRLDYPDTKVLMLTAHHYDQYVRALFAIGVHGYLLKNTSEAELVAAVRAVGRGDQVLGAEIAARISARTTGSGLGATETLTDREITEVAPPHGRNSPLY